MSAADQNTGLHAVDTDTLQDDIDATREHLGETVEALGHKLDTKQNAVRKQAMVAGAVAGVVILGLMITRRARH